MNYLLTYLSDFSTERMTFWRMPCY